MPLKKYEYLLKTNQNDKNIGKHTVYMDTENIGITRENPKHL